ncbi:histone acetyltransferase subunit NuA4-domain-containing protein [Aspergillus ambiguus]|uniref:chromatin modification-related protein EAF6/MEAF6 n=1 Tax=Aspergillus ambiguus TaxID=176160 RepID=UPI003CCCDB5E
MPESAPAASNSTNNPPTPAAASTSAAAASTQTTGATPATSNNATDQAANRGLPYYEKLRRELRDTLQKKRLMDKSMAQLEDQIYRFEQSYLEETTAGNIIKGFDNYIKGSSSGAVGAGPLALQGIGGGGGGSGARRKAPVTDADRVFSRSSASFMRDSTPSSVQTTPSHAPTPTSGYNGSSGKPGEASASGSVKGGSSKNKKKSGTKQEKLEDDEDGGDKPPAKRLKISYGRD